MGVAPLPAHGSVLVGRDRAGRTLRVSAHPDLDRVVLSIWQDTTCVATVRLATADVPELVRVLADGLVQGATPGSHEAPPRNPEAAAG
jgi:hypothetical protein